MRFVISELPICTSRFRRSLLSNLKSLIHSTGWGVTSSSLHLASFLCSIVLKSPVVVSNFLEIFIQACLVFPYLLASVFSSSNIWKHTVSSCASISSSYRLSCWETPIHKILYLLFCLIHLPGFSYHLLIGYCIP